jgi:hypothetical protein
MTAMTSAFSANQVVPPNPGLPNSSRIAATVDDIGLASASRPSQPGISSGATNVFDTMASGSTSGKSAEAPSLVRSSSPM